MQSILNPLSSDELDKVAEKMRSAARTIGDTKDAAYDCMGDVHDIEDEAFAEMCHRAEAAARGIAADLASTAADIASDVRLIGRACPASLDHARDLLAILDFNRPVPYSLTPKAYAVIGAYPTTSIE